MRRRGLGRRRRGSEASGLPVLHVFYEDLAVDGEAVQAVRDFLRVGSGCDPVLLSKAPGWVKLQITACFHSSLRLLFDTCARPFGTLRDTCEDVVGPYSKT